MDSLGLHHAFDANEVLSNARLAHKHSMTNHLNVMDLMTKAQAKRRVSLVRLQYEQQPDDILVPEECCSPSACTVAVEDAEDGQQDNSHLPLHEGFSHSSPAVSHTHHHRQVLRHQDTSRRPASRSSTLLRSGTISSTITGPLAPEPLRPASSLHVRCASPAGGLRGSANGALVPSRCASPSLPYASTSPSAPLPSPPRTPASPTALSPHPPPFAAAAKGQLCRNTRMSAPDGLQVHAPAGTAVCPDPNDQGAYPQHRTALRDEDGDPLDPSACWGDGGGDTGVLFVPAPPSPTHRAFSGQASFRPQSSPSPAAAACIHSTRTRFISDATPPAAAADSRQHAWTSGPLGSSTNSLSRLGSSTSTSGRSGGPSGRAAGSLRRASKTMGGYCADEPATRAKAAAAALVEDSGPHDPLLRDGSKVAQELHRLHSCFVEDGDDMVYFAPSDSGVTVTGNGSTCSGTSASGGHAVLAGDGNEEGAQYKQYFHHQLRHQGSLSICGTRGGSGLSGPGAHKCSDSGGDTWGPAAAPPSPHVFRPASAVAPALAACSAGGNPLRSLKTMPAALAGPGRPGSPAPDGMRTRPGDECLQRSKLQHHLSTRHHTDSGAESSPQLHGRQLKTFPGCASGSALDRDPDGLLTHGSLCISAAQPRTAVAWAAGPGSPIAPAPPASPLTPTPPSAVASGTMQQCGAARGTAVSERCGRRMVLSCPQHPISPQDLEPACRPLPQTPPQGAKRDPAAVAAPVSMATWQAMRAERARDARSSIGQHPDAHPDLHPQAHAATGTSQPCDAGPPSPSKAHTNKQPFVPRLALHQGRDQEAPVASMAAVHASTRGAAAGTAAMVATPGQDDGRPSCGPPLGQGHATPGPRFVRRWGAYPQQLQQHPQQQSPGGVCGGVLGAPAGVHVGAAGSVVGTPEGACGAAGPGNEMAAEKMAKAVEEHAPGERGALFSGMRRVLGLGRIRA